MNKLSADDIIDPEFKRKIRVVRDMEKDIIDRLSEEENLYQKNLEELAQKIAERKRRLTTSAPTSNASIATTRTVPTSPRWPAMFTNGPRARA